MTCVIAVVYPKCLLYTLYVRSIFLPCFPIDPQVRKFYSLSEMLGRFTHLSSSLSLPYMGEGDCVSQLVRLGEEVFP